MFVCSSRFVNHGFVCLCVLRYIVFVISLTSLFISHATRPSPFGTNRFKQFFCTLFDGWVSVFTHTHSTLTCHHPSLPIFTHHFLHHVHDSLLFEAEQKDRKNPKLLFIVIPPALSKTVIQYRLA